MSNWIEKMKKIRLVDKMHWMEMGENLMLSECS